MKMLFNLDETVSTLGIPPARLVDLIQRGLVPWPVQVDGLLYWNGAGLRAWVRSLNPTSPTGHAAAVLAATDTEETTTELNAPVKG
jgi:hypothetical protein